jgi:hypothetical protein
MSECGMLSVVMLSFVVPIVLVVYTVNLYENFFPDFKKTFRKLSLADKWSGTTKTFYTHNLYRN